MGSDHNNQLPGLTSGLPLADEELAEVAWIDHLINISQGKKKAEKRKIVGDDQDFTELGKKQMGDKKRTQILTENGEAVLSSTKKTKDVPNISSIARKSPKKKKESKFDNDSSTDKDNQTARTKNDTVGKNRSK